MVDAAIEAEYDTGIREETEEQARRHIVIRLATIVAGFVVLTGGLAMLVLPGPGIVGVVAGLGILSTELEWAARLMAYVKKKARYEDLQAQPMWVQASMGLVALCTLAGSLVYFTVLR
ncbi:MAG: PGPGW domain-containing protein [Microthrixaceae bacterium]|nr:PGPGW domain-containing protein [Microthrixaceae bacterium]